MSSTLTDSQRAELRRRLEELIAEAEAALAQRDADGQVVELDQTRQGRLSRMDAMQVQAMAKAAAVRARRDMAAAQAALGRLDDADFGRCEDCDEPIAWPRLQFSPANTLCVSCAEERERDA